ncbi:molecular chaperone DnaJ [Rhabdothermincola salaria]|uniref:molecular chaperone DnaJ n=1 Tax=Rhabdothermincola salaria TaxID=2903142 RepID=UPI001E363469|nr:molecular chaperone DnaJ [Rhabdothermincola salaria]MCD9622686.1 molecular chaperone DnaJ [Rhabdothermincola salaria]
MADYYELLGVSRDATADDIKRSYRRLAREHHPDANPGDVEAEARFKQVAVAYETLSDPERRRQYDMFGEAGPGAQSPFGGGGLGDIFDMFFNQGGFGGGGQTAPSGPPRGSDLEAVVDLEFADAVFGAQAPVSVRTAMPCDDCEATGAAPGSQAQTCVECAGVGQVRRVRQSILGQMVTAGPCPRCNGFGTVVPTPCPTCRGEGRSIEEHTFNVDVPAGVDTGATLRLPGRGAVGPRGGAAGDLYVHVRVAPDDRFVRHGDDLHHDLHVAATQAALGAEIPLTTLDGDEVVAVAPGTQTGKVHRLRGQGVPHLQSRGRGDLLVQIVVDTPTELSEEEAELLRQLAELRGEEVASPESGLFSRLKSAFK